jgi:hypothetical protein
MGLSAANPGSFGLGLAAWGAALGGLGRDRNCSLWGSGSENVGIMARLVLEYALLFTLLRVCNHCNLLSIDSSRYQCQCVQSFLHAGLYMRSIALL